MRDHWRTQYALVLLMSFVACAAALAAPRTAPATVHVPSTVSPAPGSDDLSTGLHASPMRFEAPRPRSADVPGGLAGRIRSGVASHYGSDCLSGCLALPEHKSWLPGIRVRVCGAAACIVRTSNDAGPALSMQRQGRIVDLARNDFEAVCGCHYGTGLTEVTVEYLGESARPRVTLPPTSTEE